ncbi:MAG: hypothetical protein Q4D29_03705 [Lachnospiraceae bacterium]|nr:hypothetical protein [Lachnospiraceae bacterium]
MNGKIRTVVIAIIAVVAIAGVIGVQMLNGARFNMRTSILGASNTNIDDNHDDSTIEVNENVNDISSFVER